MANKSLTDLTERTATADSDLIHVNSGGTDYKETKANFLQGNFYHEFAKNSSLTSQVDALPEGGYLGKVNGGTTTVTGTPANTSYYVEVQKSSASYASIRLISYSAGGYAFHKHKVNGTWASEWTQEPYREEITSLNSSLTKSSVPVTPNLSGITIQANSSFEMNGIVVLNIRATFANAVASNSSMIAVPAPKTTLSGGSGAVACAVNNTGFAASVVANGFIANNGAISAGTYIFSAIYEKA